VLPTPATLDQAQTEKIQLEEEVLEDDLELPVEIEELPEDPAETGPCSLTLNLTRAESGQPVQATVGLWRLDAPGNEHWKRGDQLQARLDVPVEGVAVDNLPAGRYRVFSGDQRVNSADSPAFDVAGPKTVVTLSLPMPRKFHVHVRIYTESGHVLLRATRDELGSSTYGGTLDPPKWRKKRWLKSGSCFGGTRSLGIGCGSNRAPAYEVAGTEAGFHLGLYREDARRSSRTSSHSFENEGRTIVRLFLTREIQRDRSYIALSVPEEPILASIVLPDGRLASDAGADIRIYCSAKLEEPDVPTVSTLQAIGGKRDEGTATRPPPRGFGKPKRPSRGTPPGAWRTLPIKVDARLDGFERLTFEYRLGDPLPVRCLQPGGG